MSALAFASKYVPSRKARKGKLSRVLVPRGSEEKVTQERSSSETARLSIGYLSRGPELRFK